MGPSCYGEKKNWGLKSPPLWCPYAMALCVAMAFSGGLLVELSVCVVSIALKRFDCIVLIGPDTRGSYKYGHCGWIGGKAVVRRLSRARFCWILRVGVGEIIHINCYDDDEGFDGARDKFLVDDWSMLTYELTTLLTPSVSGPLSSHAKQRWMNGQVGTYSFTTPNKSHPFQERGGWCRRRAQSWQRGGSEFEFSEVCIKWLGTISDCSEHFLFFCYCPPPPHE